MCLFITQILHPKLERWKVPLPCRFVSIGNWSHCGWMLFLTSPNTEYYRILTTKPRLIQLYVPILCNPYNLGSIPFFEVKTSYWWACGVICNNLIVLCKASTGLINEIMIFLKHMVIQPIFVIRELRYFKPPQISHRK